MCLWRCCNRLEQYQDKNACFPENITAPVADPLALWSQFCTESNIVSVLKTSNRSSARPIVEHTVAAWYDLNHLAAGPEGLSFISLFDDTSDVWTDEDFKLVEPLSTISRWSRQDEFVNILSEVA